MLLFLVYVYVNCEEEAEELYNRRLNRIQHNYHLDPFTRHFLKYFIKNPHQRREKRQIQQQNYAYSRYPTFNSNYPVRYDYNTIKYPNTPYRNQNVRRQSPTQSRRQSTTQTRRQSSTQTRRQTSNNVDLQKSGSNIVSSVVRKRFIPRPVFA